MPGIKTLIVDDEPVARKILREELEQFDKSQSRAKRKMALRRWRQFLNYGPILYFSICRCLVSAASMLSAACVHAGTYR
jgi:CheY-like chemotaxis protein